MAFKQFELDDGTVFTVYKRRASRHLRLSVSPRGQVRVSIPMWAPYKTGVAFAKTRASWIKRQLKPTPILTEGQPVGKAHHLQFVPSPQTKATTRIKGSDIEVKFPHQLDSADASVQAAASRASLRALRSQAEKLLPQRVAHLAAQHGFSYTSIAIKQLHGRWGSCDQHQNLTFNLYLMQLPWELIDYVILHELVHTQVLKHGPEFWAAMAEVLPNVKTLRKQMREYQPVLHGSIAEAVA